MRPIASPAPDQVLPTLHRQRARLASASVQRSVLAAVPLHRTFEQRLETAGLLPLRPTGIEVLQVNVGRKCNQTCRHCHVDAGPDRREMMSDRVLDRCLLRFNRLNTLTYHARDAAAPCRRPAGAGGDPDPVTRRDPAPAEGARLRGL